MQHVSLNEGRDIVPLHCPSCGQLLCERLGKLQSNRALRCPICHSNNDLDRLADRNPALGRVLLVHSSIKTIHGGA